MEYHDSLRLLEVPFGYAIDEHGNVFSRRSRNGKGPIKDQWRPVARSVGTHGYYSFMADKKRYLVHQVVAHVFHGPCPDGCEVSHKNGIRLDCYWRNLEYLTHAENERMKRLHGTAPRGSRNGTAKLTEDQVREILRLSVGPGRMKGVALATRFGISQGIVSEIRSGKRWTHVADALISPVVPTQGARA